MPEAMFLVGDAEKHEIRIYLSFWWGKVTIDVDGKRVVETRNWGISKDINFPFGVAERHEARVKVIATQSFELYVDGGFVGKTTTALAKLLSR